MKNIFSLKFNAIGPIATWLITLLIEFCLLYFVTSPGILIISWLLVILGTIISASFFLIQHTGYKPDREYIPPFYYALFYLFGKIRKVETIKTVPTYVLNMDNKLFFYKKDFYILTLIDSFPIDMFSDKDKFIDMVESKLLSIERKEKEKLDIFKSL